MRRLLLGAVALLVAVAAGAGEVRVPVRYRSATTVYLSGGSADGLAVGDRLTVAAGKETVGELEVVYLAEHSASCKVVRETRPLKPGDVAVITKESAPEVTTVDTPRAPVVVPSAAPPAPRTGPLAPFARTRGGVSFGYFKYWDDTPTGFDFEQRTARLDLSAWDIGGHPLQLNARARGRQDLRTRPPGSTFENLPTDERRDRFYELSLRYDPPKGLFSLEAGRLSGAALGLGPLDGGVVELRPRQSLRLGGFFGRRADVYGEPAFTSGNKYGGFLRLGGGPGGAAGFDGILLGAREFAGSDVSREYLGWQGRVGTRRLSFFQWAEVDLFRGWRQEAQDRSAQLSNLSLAANWRAGTSTRLGVSYDLRRNYRTAETRSVADILFDTFLRQGLRANLDYSRPNGLGVSVFGGVRLSDQPDTKDAYSFGAGLRHARLFGTRFSGGVDGAGFSNGASSGYQAYARLGWSSRSVHADAGWGLTSYTQPDSSLPRRTNQWLRGSGRFELGHGFWVLGDLQYAHGDDAQGPRATAEAGVRF